MEENETTSNEDLVTKTIEQIKEFMLPVNKNWWKWAALAFILLVMLPSLCSCCGLAGLAANSAQTPAPVEEEAVEKPAPKPDPVPEAVVEKTTPQKEENENPVTAEEVESAFWDFVNERAAAGVYIAGAITDIKYENRVVTVVFDPVAAGLDLELFNAVNPFDNLAEFVATPIEFDDKIGNRLRPAIDAVETFSSSGQSLGRATIQEIKSWNEL